MKILKYKKQTSGRYKIFFDNDTDLLLYEDVILKYELLLKKELSDKKLEDVLNYNMECDVYYVALKSLNSRFKSVKELKDSLIKKEYPQEYVDKAILKLLNQGYLDDRSFSKSYINSQIITTSKGPNKISKELKSKGVSDDIINEEILAFSIEEQKSKIDKVINRLIKSNKTRGGVVLKNKIVTDLINLGYSSSIINDIISNYSFDTDSSIREKEYNKLYNRLSRKHSGKELEYKIREKLFQKGLYYEE
ncbi:MAG: hypothetical protein E7160_03585 [Firmicutes bacterium]|nr:hypothetical protein [Bacillota bacterium]